jgi:hypothetical protein
MSSNQLVNNLRVSDAEFKYCETCKVLKSKHLSTQRKEECKPRAYGEAISIHIDVMPCESLKGYKYRLDVIDHGISWL